MSRKLKPTPKLSVAKRQPPKWQRERSLALVTWLVIPLVILLAVVLVGYWSYDAYVAVWNKPILTLGNETTGNVTTINMRDYVKTLRFYGLTSMGNMSQSTWPYQVLQEIKTDELVLAATSAQGIHVSQDEITAKINSDLIASASSGNSTGNITGNITQPETELGKKYQTWLKNIGLSDSEFRHYLEAKLAEQKLYDSLLQSIPTASTQVHIYWIQLPDLGNATEVADKLANGEDFAALAAAYSTDTTTKDNGGDLGWVPQGILLPQIDDVAFNLEPGNFSAPVLASNNAYYIIKVTDKEDSRPVEEGYIQMLAYYAYNDWFTEQSNALGVLEYWTQDKANWAMNHIN